MTRKRSEDPARRIRGRYVSDLPPDHVRTVYARMAVCARCGQIWPCEMVSTGKMTAMTEREAS